MFTWHFKEEFDKIINPGDFGIFEEVPGGILIKPISAKELER